MHLTQHLTRQLMLIFILGVLVRLGPPPTALAQSQQIGAEALQQMSALLAEKKSRSPSQKKLASAILFELKRQRNDPLLAGMPTLRTGLKQEANGT